ncbi:MerR family transcriptional regulator [Paenibacillus sepulcri]|uniref:MerR family transcriptional regulator n=1 Tax=Paenibacillus sepulcri TaxID=359917 RepID=UPI001AE17FFE
MPLYIHETAKWLGTTPRAIRLYEEKGLIAPDKSPVNGYRIYRKHDLERLRWIIALRELGLSLAAISDMIPAARPFLRAVEDSDSMDSTDIPDHAPGISSHTRKDASLALLGKLDEARKAIYEEWSRLSQALQALDSMLASGFVRQDLTLTELESTAAEIRQLSAVRSSWHDQWDYDRLASSHRELAVLQALHPLVNEQDYQLAHDAIAQWIDPVSGDRGIDLAAGTGSLTARLARSGAVLTAVEQSVEMLALLRKSLPEIEAKQGNLLALPFQGAAFDFASCAFAMHYLDERQQQLALAEMDRMLLPDGRLCLAGVVIESSPADPPAKSPAQYPTDPKQVAAWLGQLGYETIMPTLTPSLWIIFAHKQRRNRT